MNDDTGFPYASECCTSGCGDNCLAKDDNYTSLAYCESTARSVYNDGLVEISSEETEGDLLVRNMESRLVAVFQIDTPDENMDQYL